ncbi:MAG: EI24 domain-containing protein [Verrucomicrobiota bacterium]
MKRLSSLAKGFRLPFIALKLLFTVSGIKRYAILPWLTNTILYFSMFATSLYLVSTLHISFENFSLLDNWPIEVVTLFNYSAEILKWVFFLPLAFFVCLYTFSAVGMIVASPLNDLLSHKTELLLSLKNPSKDQIRSEQKLLYTNMLYSLRDSAYIVIRQLFFTLLTIPFLLVPFVGFLPLFLVTAYHTGLGFLSIPADRQGLRYQQKKAIFRKHLWEFVGLGIAMEFLFLIPLTALFFLPLGVISGTLLYLKLDLEENLSRHIRT